MANPLDYVRNVRLEMKKVTWPSRKETTAGTIAVFVMVFMASIFMYFADQMMAFIVRIVLGISV